ncbi:MAG: hypothetical protein ACE5IP_03855 [Terriglobia bacterium]
MRRVRPTRGERGGALQVTLAILGGLVVLACLVVLVAIWAVNRYVKIEVQQEGGEKHVSISTPFGDLEVDQAEDAARRLKLPVYPGATPKEDSVAVRLRGYLGKQEGGLDITAAQFRSDDEFARVDAWYRERLGQEFERREGRIAGADHDGDIDLGDDWKIRIEPGGDDVLYSHEREGRTRGVALQHEHGRVEITLFDLAEARYQ